MRASQILNSSYESHGKPRAARVLRENPLSICTISGHRPVNSAHSLENTSSYNVRFFID
jgi:hypothetical protein